MTTIRKLVLIVIACCLMIVIVLSLYLWNKPSSPVPLPSINRDMFPLTVEEGDLSNHVNVLSEGALGDGITDDTVNLQRTIDKAAAVGITVYFPAKTYLVSPKKARNGASNDWWCLTIPSNASIRFQPGAVLKVIDNAPATTRILVMNRVNNVNLMGHVEIDGRSGTVKAGNEHMAGIFIFSSTKISMESAYSHDSYGDNLFVGGTEEEPSEQVAIRYFKGTTAGRKNMVIHYVDNLHVGTAVLDNSLGGAPNFKGSNSLDVEPDAFKGSRSFKQWIDNLTTYGTGNDFTVGTERALAEKWVVKVGNFTSYTVGIEKDVDGDTSSLLMYAITLIIDKFTLVSKDDNANKGVKMIYGGVLEIRNAQIEGGRGMALDLHSQSNDKKPKVEIGTLKVDRPLGGGIRAWGADVSIDHFEVKRLMGKALDLYGTTEHSVSIKNAKIVDSGAEQSLYVAKYEDNKTRLDIGTLLVMDSRTKKVGHILEFGSEAAKSDTRIGKIYNPNNITEYTVR
ncbi:glycosyl hydrolase family 28-related protein [Paenibacillus sp. MBLB4367]|uniref:glycosyl hydrolase family 28-related protein n=1 Tax=Paenibacillus sp. MBLB4367 TaxID=3384767 RepID=UPI0039081CF2